MKLARGSVSSFKLILRIHERILFVLLLNSSKIVLLRTDAATLLYVGLKHVDVAVIASINKIRA